MRDLDNRTVIFSGGSGNIAILKGLFRLGYRSKDITIITNAYDNGKNTGICRAITNKLGASNVIKNHFNIYKLEHEKDLNDNIVKFYDTRLNLTRGHEKEECLALLEEVGASKLSVYVESFFNSDRCCDFEFNDFSIVDILYAQMWKDVGYLETNNFFCDMLNIDRNCVVINSLSNKYIYAVTKSGNTIDDEGIIVEYCNAQDKIDDVYFNSIEENLSLEYVYNELIVRRIIYKATAIIISCGTFWSSIYPTFKVNNLYDEINNSSATKTWFINTEEDKDSFGVTADEFIDKLSSTGLDLTNIIIVTNKSGCDTLRESSNKNTISIFLGNINGKYEDYAITTTLNFLINMI